MPARPLVATLKKDEFGRQSKTSIPLLRAVLLLGCLPSYSAYHNRATPDSGCAGDLVSHTSHFKIISSKTYSKIVY